MKSLTLIERRVQRLEDAQNGAMHRVLMTQVELRQRMARILVRDYPEVAQMYAAKEPA